MPSPLVTINHNEHISEAAERMSDKIRNLVVSDNGKIVGIPTAYDLVPQLAK